MSPIVFGSPGRYIQGEALLDRLGLYLSGYANQVLFVCDAFVGKLVKPTIVSSCHGQNIRTAWIEFDGELTAQAVDRLKREAQSADFQLVVAVGGGKTLDAGKALAHSSNRPFVAVPTVASNDSPTSKNYVIYDDNHHLAEVRNMPRSAVLVIADTTLLARAPRHFLIAGIGDALSKYFEAEQCMKSNGANLFGARPSYSGFVLAKACYATIREYAEHALTGLPSAPQGCATTVAFDRLIEAVILMSGLGFESGGLSVAHSMTRGFSRVPGCATAAHGLAVAYGLLVQLRLERRSESFIHELLSFYQRIGLPKTLSELGATSNDRAIRQSIADYTMTAPHIRNFERTLNAEDIVAAMEAIDSMTHELR
ncbi:glycerol dehydrogenase [Paraburkholderia sp. GAS199]|uniref:glycerol dehydrogenase n=1 Tax=Paraburkholderia sp. GAS199 TaxID=3035126 RepID=UPI003D232271